MKGTMGDFPEDDVLYLDCIHVSILIVTIAL